MLRVRTMIGCPAAFLLISAAPTLAQPSGVSAYEVVSIGVLEGHRSSFVEELDEYARVVAWSRAVSGQTYSMVWINGDRFTPPVPPGGETASLFGISPTSGLLVGDSRVNQGTRAAAWKIGVGSTLLETLGGSSFCLAGTANDAGWMVGSCDAANRSALWPRLDAPIDLGRFGDHGGNEGANDINELGEIVGRSDTNDRVTRPYLWRNGQMIDIGGEPSDQRGFAYGINDRTEVVGYFSNTPPGRREAYYWRDGESVVLPEAYPCGGGLRKARAISDAGIIVGQAADADCAVLYAAIWDRDDNFHPYLLNDLIPRHPDLQIIDADDVNEAGQIAAFGEYDDGRERGLLVTPYLFLMSDPMPGIAGRANTITVTGLQPNQRILLAYGTREGAQRIRPSCPGGTLLIRDPQTSPIVRADANGIATITVNVPLSARGRTIRMQAIAPFECEISHTVTWTFE